MTDNQIKAELQDAWQYVASDFCATEGIAHREDLMDLLLGSQFHEWSEKNKDRAEKLAMEMWPEDMNKA